MSGAQLALSSAVTPQTMATVLSNLRAKGLIHREPSAVHAKVLIVTVTEEGRALLDRAYEEVIALERAFNEAFSPTEHKMLCELLERATAVLAQPPPEV
jgi:DNA-binding MarR family transcriptional regulator